MHFPIHLINFIIIHVNNLILYELSKPLEIKVIREVSSA